MREQIISIKKVEGGYWGGILLDGRIQTALFFDDKEWTQDQVVRRLSRHMSKPEEDNI